MLEDTGRAIRRVMMGATLPLTLPWLMIRMVPVTTPDMPSVITKGEIFRKVMPAPLSRPISPPTASETSSAGSTIPSCPLTIT